jgi:23S rRNA-/tRNA-specific pseudouridylate synthase
MHSSADTTCWREQEGSGGKRDDNEHGSSRRRGRKKQRKAAGAVEVGAATAVREATPVHRLGRGTSGVLLCARSQAAREGLSRAFAEDAKGERRQALNAT